MIKSPIFTKEQFIDTEHDPASEKAAFINALCWFLIRGCQRNCFTKRMYHHLSLYMGHIAHYNIDGFYAEWFSTISRQIEFIRDHSSPFRQVYGDWQDVYDVFREWLLNSGVILEYETRHAEYRRQLNIQTAKSALMALPDKDRRDILKEYSELQADRDADAAIEFEQMKGRA